VSQRSLLRGTPLDVTFKGLLFVRRPHPQSQRRRHLSRIGGLKLTAEPPWRFVRLGPAGALGPRGSRAVQAVQGTLKTTKKTKTSPSCQQPFRTAPCQQGQITDKIAKEGTQIGQPRPPTSFCLQDQGITTQIRHAARRMTSTQGPPDPVAGRVESSPPYDDRVSIIPCVLRALAKSVYTQDGRDEREHQALAALGRPRPLGVDGARPANAPPYAITLANTRPWPRLQPRRCVNTCVHEVSATQRSFQAH